MRELSLQEANSVSGGDWIDPGQYIPNPESELGKTVNDGYRLGYNIFTNIFEFLRLG